MTELVSWQIVNQVKQLGLNQASEKLLQYPSLAQTIDELLEVGVPPKAGTSTQHTVIGFLNNWVFQRERGYWEGFGPDFGWGFRRTFSDKATFKEFVKVLKQYDFRRDIYLPGFPF